MPIDMELTNNNSLFNLLYYISRSSTKSITLSTNSSKSFGALYYVVYRCQKIVWAGVAHQQAYVSLTMNITSRSNVKFRHESAGHWVLNWWRHCCCRGWITVICHLRFPSVQHPTAPCTRFRIQLPVWSSTFVAPTTSLTRLHVFMGSVSLTTPSVSVSRWRHGFSFNLYGLPPSYLHGFVPSMAGHPGMCSASLQRLIVSRTRVISVVTGLFQLLVPSCGTIYRHLWPLLQSSTYSATDWIYLFKFSCPGIVIQTLVSDYSYKMSKQLKCRKLYKDRFDSQFLFDFRWLSES
jgi:hypothetical protein